MSLTTFPPFKELPLEMQMQIYEHAFDDFFLSADVKGLLLEWDYGGHPWVANFIAKRAGSITRHELLDALDRP